MLEVQKLDSEGGHREGNLTRERVKYEEMKRLYVKCRIFLVTENFMELRLYLGANLRIVTLICLKIMK